MSIPLAEQETYDYESFCAALKIVNSAKKRGVKPWLVWSALRAALPDEYRTDKQGIAEHAETMIARYQRILDETRKPSL